MKKKYILGLLKRPRERAIILPIKNELQCLQELVGGYIEVVSFAEDCAVICNEEGRLLGLEYNISFLGCDFYGPIVMVGTDGDDFVSMKTTDVYFLADMINTIEEVRDGKL